MDMEYTKALIEEKSADEFTAIASSEKTDRADEVIDITAWDLKNFKNNPILLWMHDHTKPLGKVNRIWVDKATKQLRFKGIVSTATEWGRAAKQLMEEGILNSFSVGFRVHDMDGNHITKAELHEISLVSVPANPEARLLAAKSLDKAGFDESIIKQFTGDEDEETKVPVDTHVDFEEVLEQIAEAKKIAEEAKEQAAIAVKGLQYLNPQGSKPEAVSKRLQLSKAIVRAADNLVVESKSPKTVNSAKLIKRSSEKLIQNLKGDL